VKQIGLHDDDDDEDEEDEENEDEEIKWTFSFISSQTDGPVYLWENVDVFIVGLGRAYDNPSEIAARPDGCRGFDHFSVGLYFTLVS